MSPLGTSHHGKGLPAAWRRLAWLLLPALPCGAYLAAELYLLDGGLGFPLDDSWIHLQFARNLADGHGLSYRAGELVTGSTAPLWTALLSLLLLLPGGPFAWVKAAGIACHLVTVVGTQRLARELGARGPLPALAAVLVATTSWLVWSALSGMEVPLFCALATWGMALHVAERRVVDRAPLSMCLLAFSCLARPEGCLLLALAMADRLLVLRREGGQLRVLAPVWQKVGEALLLAALVVVPLGAAYQAIGGSPLPTTFSTKAGYSAPGWPQPAFLFGVFELLAQAQPFAALLAPAGALVLLARLGSEDDRGVLLVLWTCGLPLAYGVLSGDGKGIYGNFGRYFFPLFPALAVLAVLAVEPLRRALPGRLRIGGLSIAWGWLALALALVPTLLALLGGVGRYTRSLLDVEDGDVRMARLLAGNLDPRATLAVDDIGAFGYLLPNRLVDLAGIVSPQVHAYARRAWAESRSYCPGLLAYVVDVRPDYLLGFPNRHACFPAEQFPAVLRVEVPGNRTLGDDHIVLHSTPWTRYPLRAPATASPR